MKINKLSTTLLALLGSWHFAAKAQTESPVTLEPNLYDTLMSKTVGQYKIGQRELNYRVSGQLNYVHGFNDLESGFQNSNLDLSTSSPLAYGVDAIISMGVREIYNAPFDDFNTKWDANLTLTKNSHELKVGYDKYIANRVLGGKIKMNADSSLTKNVIGQQLSSYEGYGEYSYSFQNYNLAAAVDFRGNIYGSFSAYADGTDIKLHLFEGGNNDINTFFDVATVINKSIKASVGLGFISDKISFMGDAIYFVTDAFSLYANILGNEDYSSATLGAEYVHGSLAAYIEGAAELSDPHTKTGSGGFVIGAKFMF